MVQMGTQFDNLTISDYRKWNNLNLLDDVEPGYHNYCLELAHLSDRYKNQEDNSLFLIHQFITCICSLVLNEQKDYPLIPLLQSKKGQTFSIDDFTVANMGLLNEFIPETDNNLLRARFADIIWIKTHAHEKALIAIESYLNTSINAEAWDSVYDECVKRAIVLCKQLGNNQKAIQFLSTIKEYLLKNILEENTPDITNILDCAAILHQNKTIIRIIRMKTNNVCCRVGNAKKQRRICVDNIALLISFEIQFYVFFCIVFCF